MGWATTGACALDPSGGNAASDLRIDGGADATTDGATRLDGAPGMPLDASPSPPDGADSEVPDASAPDIGAPDTSVDSAPKPLCPKPPQGISIWLHDGLAYDDALHLASLTLRGAPTVQPANAGGSGWKLAGGEDALFYGTASTVIDDGLHLTIEGWVNPSDPADNARLVDRSLPNKPETGFGFDILTTGVLRIFYGEFTAPFHSVQTPAGTVLAGAWQHLASTIEVKASGGGGGGTVTMALYINGASQSLDWSPSLGPNPGQFSDDRPIPPGSMPVVFGGSPEANAALGLVGQLGDVAVWNRTLSPSEIQKIATGGPLVRCGL